MSFREFLEEKSPKEKYFSQSVIANNETKIDMAE